MDWRYHRQYCNFVIQDSEFQYESMKADGNHGMWYGTLSSYSHALIRHLAKCAGRIHVYIGPDLTRPHKIGHTVE